MSFWANSLNNFKPQNFGGLPTSAAIPLPQLTIDANKVRYYYPCNLPILSTVNPKPQPTEQISNIC